MENTDLMYAEHSSVLDSGYHEPLSSASRRKRDFGIDVDELSLMIAKHQPLIFLDVRPATEYLEGHLSEAISMVCPTMFRRRLMKGTMRIEELICQSKRDAMVSCFATHRFVLYDNKSEELSKDEESVINVLLKCLNDLTLNPCFVRGGFLRIKISLPHEINVALPSSSSHSSPFLQAHARTQGRFRSQEITVDIKNVCLSEIVKHVFIGAHDDARNREALRRNKIKYVLNVTPDVPNYFEPELTYMNIPILDTWNQNICAHFASTAEFIDHAVQQGVGVLVHCAAGISRSSTIVIAYIMSKYHINHSDALHFVLSRRPIVSPNLDFMGQLLQLERTLVCVPLDQSSLPAFEPLYSTPPALGPMAALPGLQQQIQGQETTISAH